MQLKWNCSLLFYLRWNFHVSNVHDWGSMVITSWVDCFTKMIFCSTTGDPWQTNFSKRWPICLCLHDFILSNLAGLVIVQTPVFQIILLCVLSFCGESFEREFNIFLKLWWRILKDTRYLQRFGLLVAMVKDKDFEDHRIDSTQYSK